MKFSKFLINEIKRLQLELNLPVLRWSNSNKILKKRCIQLKKLTSFLDNKHKSFHSIKNRMEILEYGIRSVSKCEICGSDIKQYGRSTCSTKCGSVLTRQNMTDYQKSEMIRKATESRNYEAIHKKRIETMRNDIDENGLNSFERAQIKSIETMRNDIDENGLNSFERRNKKAVETIKRNQGYDIIGQKISKTKRENYCPENNHWNKIDEKTKQERINKQYESARKTHEISGRWRPLSEVNDYEMYFNASSFKHGFETNNENEIKLLNEYGVFNAKTNTRGCVRDHLLSRRFGFENNIPTWIISHPANCEIVLHSENVKRVFNDGDNQITFEELMVRIENYK